MNIHVNPLLKRPMERRAVVRVPCRTQVRVFLDDGPFAESFWLDSADLCAEGLFLRSDVLLSIGEWLEVELCVPGRINPIRSKARVVRVIPTYMEPGPGMALKLTTLSAADAAALNRALPSTLGTTRGATAID